MQALYIANATHQVQDFHYRVPEVSQPRQQKIPVGGQIRISGDLSPLDIEAIIKQHVKYGMVSVNEIGKTRAFAPYFYQLDKPISPEKIKILSDRNIGVLSDRGEEQRKEAAVVMATNIGANLMSQGAERGIESIEVETTEEDNGRARNRRSETGGTRIDETTVVEREDLVGRSRGRRGRQG